MIILIMPQTKAEVPTVAVKSKALVVVKGGGGSEGGGSDSGGDNGGS